MPQRVSDADLQKWLDEYKSGESASKLVPALPRIIADLQDARREIKRSTEIF